MIKFATFWFVFCSELMSLGISISKSSTTVTLLRSVFKLTCCSVIGWESSSSDVIVLLSSGLMMSIVLPRDWLCSASVSLAVSLTGLRC